VRSRGIRTQPLTTHLARGAPRTAASTSERGVRGMLVCEASSWGALATGAVTRGAATTGSVMSRAERDGWIERPRRRPICVVRVVGAPLPNDAWRAAEIAAICHTAIGYLVSGSNAK
jgi:hypothetical protein